MVIFDFTTLLRPYGEKNRLKANFFLMSLNASELCNESIEKPARMSGF